MKQHFRAGFTLIELLVVITIIMFLTGGGIASFLTFNDRQTVQNGAKLVQTYMRQAQGKARAGEKPPACAAAKLTGYRVQLTANSSQVILSAVCTNGVHTHTSYTLPGGVISENNHTITFANLYGGVINAGTVTIMSNPANVTDYSYSFEVTPGGEIDIGGFE
jgi:type II secretory pathway pseudopilin PulG